MLNESHWTWTQQRKGKNYGQGKTLTRRNHPKLRGVEVHVSRSLKAEEASRKEGITEQTFYRWRKKFWGLRVDQAKRMKELDKAILREVSSGNF